MELDLFIQGICVKKQKGDGPSGNVQLVVKPIQKKKKM